jgi:hypothetical protein
MRIRPLLAAGALAVSCIAVAASGENKASSTATSAGKTASFKVGESVKLGDWAVTVNGVQNPFTSSNAFDEPKAGKKFVAVDISAQNNGDKSQTVSSLLCFSLVDSTGQKYDQALVVGAPAAPNGDIAPGETTRGTIVYEVPENATGLQEKFKCSLFSSGSATINLG